MFKTYEQISQRYPIGYIYKIEPVSQRLYCAHEVVFDKMKEYYGNENVKMVSPHHALYTHLVPYTIKGYYFDGEYWYPVDDMKILTPEEIDESED